METIDIDWSKVWEKQMADNHRSRGMECARIWEDKTSARRYLAAAGKQSRGRVTKILASLPVTAASRVLDIGAGPGVLAVPLAEKATHVTAVEPSGGMMAVLREQMMQEGLDNIHCVQKRWDDVVVEADLRGPYDVVVASMSLGMPDIRGAICKMEAAASGYIVLVWGAGRASWESMPKELWPVLFNKAYQPGPKSDVLFNVLYQMGIYPGVSVIEFQHHSRFASLDEAVAHFSSMYGLYTPRQLSVMREYLERTLMSDKGSLVMEGRSTCMQFQWEKRQQEK